jgi:hypothetical protein
MSEPNYVVLELAPDFVIVAVRFDGVWRVYRYLREDKDGI